MKHFAVLCTATVLAATLTACHGDNLPAEHN